VKAEGEQLPREVGGPVGGGGDLLDAGGGVRSHRTTHLEQRDLHLDDREQIVRQAELLARRTPEFRDYRKLYVRVKGMRERDPNHPDLKSLTKEMKLLNEARVRRHKRVRELLEEGRSFDALAEKIKNLPGNRERGTKIPQELKSTPEFKKFRSLRVSLNTAIREQSKAVPRYQKLLEEARTTLYALVDKHEKK
jgi:adenine C2-methylase RlmN of 23S rRNA A2503 and tRNA A37